MLQTNIIQHKYEYNLNTVLFTDARRCLTESGFTLLLACIRAHFCMLG